MPIFVRTLYKLRIHDFLFKHRLLIAKSIPTILCTYEYNDDEIREVYKHIIGEIEPKEKEEVLKIIRPLNPSVSITGGEPTLSPILTDVLKLVDKYNFRKRTITTNGSRLFNIQDGDTILNNLINYEKNYTGNN